MGRQHAYDVTVRWSGETTDYRGYSRTHEVSAAGKPSFEGSADPHFRGDASQWNPEELLVASLSQCHMLSYLAVCALGGVRVTGYQDTASGVMEEVRGSGGRFTEVVLHPVVTVAEEAMVEKAVELHRSAHQHCFIANSVNFPVRHEPRVVVRAG